MVARDEAPDFLLFKPMCGDASQLGVERHEPCGLAYPRRQRLLEQRAFNCRGCFDLAIDQPHHAHLPGWAQVWAVGCGLYMRGVGYSAAGDVFGARAGHHRRIAGGYCDELERAKKVYHAWS